MIFTTVKTRGVTYLQPQFFRTYTTVFNRSVLYILLLQFFVLPPPFYRSIFYIQLRCLFLQPRILTVVFWKDQFLTKKPQFKT